MIHLFSQASVKLIAVFLNCHISIKNKVKYQHDKSISKTYACFLA